MENKTTHPIIFYATPETSVNIEVYFENETLWLSQKQLSSLFDVDRTVITKHLKNIFEGEELTEDSNVQKMHFAHSTKPIKFYSLDAIISVGYRVNSPITKQFYAMVQNKFHFAIIGNTAAEIIYKSADKELPYMGLKSWKNSPDGRIIKSDTTVAKNYLTEKEIKQLERISSAYFDYIEGIIERRQTLTMEELSISINKFLNFNEYQVLEGHGKISRKKAVQKAFSEYEEFKIIQDRIFISDFDKESKRLLENNNPKD